MDLLLPLREERYPILRIHRKNHIYTGKIMRISGVGLSGLRVDTGKTSYISRMPGQHLNAEIIEYEIIDALGIDRLPMRTAKVH